MRTEAVSLRHLRTGPPAVVALAEPTGRDEMAIDGVDTRAAVALIDRLLGSAAGIDALHLSASDRDALLAALHRHCWGDRIVSTITCAACGTPFDLSFDLSAVQRHVAAAHDWRGAEGGRVVHDDGRVFVVPTAADELATVPLPPVAAIEHLAAVAGGADDVNGASAALEAAAPIVDLDLDATCANCAHPQQAHFDLQSYVLQRLLNERETLLGEVHALAARYGWALADILALPRADRRAFAAMATETGARTPARARRRGLS